MDDPLAVEAQVCLTMSAAARSLVAFYRPLLEPLGLTHPQYLAMLALWQYGRLSLKDLAALLHLEPATASPLVKRLELDSDADGMRHGVEPTDAGAASRIDRDLVSAEAASRSGRGWCGRRDQQLRRGPDLLDLLGRQPQAVDHGGGDPDR